MKEATAKKEVFLLFFFHKNNGKQRSQLFFSLCALGCRSTCGQRWFFSSTALLLPPREEVCMKAEEERGNWENSSRRQIHPWLLKAIVCPLPAPSPSLHLPPPPQFPCQRPSCCHVMCWHCGSRWESQHWLMVQWAPRGVFISLKIHKAAVTNRPLMLQSRICSETSFREIREKSRRNSLAAYSFTWSAVSVTISWVVGDERRSKTKKMTLEPVVLDSGVLKGLFTQNVLLFTHRAITTIDNNIWPNCLHYLISLFCFLLGWQKVIKVNLRSMCSLYIYIYIYLCFSFCIQWKKYNRGLERHKSQTEFLFLVQFPFNTA